MLIPLFLHLNTKLFADLPLHVWSCLVVAVDVFSFSQLRAARDQMVNGLVETATKSAFWVHVRLLEDVVMVSACGEALVLGLLLLLLFPFHGHPHGCLSSLTALPSKTIIRDMQHLSLKIQRFAGKHATKTASAGAHRKAHSPQVSYTTFSVLSHEKKFFHIYANQGNVVPQSRVQHFLFDGDPS